MSSEKTILIRGTELLAKGEMDNVALDEGAVVLEQASGRHVLYGCYTSPAFPLPVSEEILVSWNADTPEGTVVETQARVLVHNEWSEWLNFGKWSPYLERQGVWQPPRAVPYVRGGRLVVPTKNAISIQLRTYLYTHDDTRTPALRLLCASARPRVWQKSPGRTVNREIRLPAYSQLVRAPAFGGMLSASTTLAALMNRFGQDILPEELAMVSQDASSEAPEANAAFAAAAAGCYGYPAWQAWLDLAGLREEIRQGNPVMARVEYAGRPEEEAPGLPWMEGVTGTARHHWLAVRGFEHDESKKEDYVLVCDPLSGTDYGAERRYRLDSFLKAFGGECLLVRRGQKGGGSAAPERLCCELRETGEPRCFWLYREGRALPVQGAEETHPGEPASQENAPAVKETAGEHIQPAEVTSSPAENVPAAVPPAEPAAPVRELVRCILACTRQEGKAYPTSAHKHFRFDVSVTREGAVRLPASVCLPGSRVTVYVIDSSGRMRVAERIL